MKPVRAGSFGLALLLVLLTACTTTEIGGQQVAIRSADPVFIDELLNGSASPPRRIYGWLRMPAHPTRGPAPALVLLHTSFGQGEQDKQYADVFTAMGFAVLAINSFKPRGVSNTTQDQSLVTESSMIADAYAALAYLSARPDIDKSRIGVVGFSKGGIAALYASLTSIRTALARNGESFAAHVAYYPWCGLRFLSPKTTGAPILVQSGGADEITPPGLCLDFLEQLRLLNPAQQADMIVHDGARHGFDHPSLKNVTWAPVGGVTPASCLIREVRPNEFVEQSTGRKVSSGTLKSVIWDCSGSFGIAGGDPEAGRKALSKTMAFLRRTLLH